ncbi:MAG TPA: DUF3617 family protein [Caulobacteraceae bacterium]|nr:DUF3617 family protein [Caulobacteraceae bacterium]
MPKSLFLALLVATGVLLSAAMTPGDIPRRKAGWWQMTMHLPGGRTMARNLCLDATSDIRNNVLKPTNGCTMTAERLPNGYSYRKTCGGEVTTGTAVGDFNRAYAITEARGRTTIQTDARWMGACPAGHHADEMWM